MTGSPYTLPPELNRMKVEPIPLDVSRINGESAKSQGQLELLFSGELFPERQIRFYMKLVYGSFVLRTVELGRQTATEAAGKFDQYHEQLRRTPAAVKERDHVPINECPYEVTSFPCVVQPLVV